NRLGRRSDAVDRTIRINSVAAHVVGIAPARFFGLRAGEWPDVFAPLAMKVAFQPIRSASTPQGEDDRNWWVRQMARLKPDVSEGAAMAQIAGQFRNMAVPAGVQVEPGMVPDLFLLPGGHGLDGLNRADTDALWILMRLVAVVLLMVCV